MCSVIKIQNVSFGKANSNKIDILIFNTIQGVSTTYNFPYNVLKSQPLTVTKRITEFKLTFLLLSTDFQSCRRDELVRGLIFFIYLIPFITDGS